MSYDPDQDSTTKHLREWLSQGQCEGLFDDKLRWLPGKADAIKEWLDRGKRSGVLLLAGELAPADRASLERRFYFVVGYLLAMMIAGIWVIVSGISQGWLTLPYLSAIAGLLGSATAAYISCLNRRANGFEDRQGNGFPDPLVKKERFGEGMSYWFLGRPFLGAVMGLIAYWGLSGGISYEGTTAFPESATRVAFIGSIAGLFAKTLYEILLGALKATFKH
jgi:hypothetical protein